MKVIAIQAPGGPEVLQELTRTVPVPGSHEVLIEVSYSGINRPDVFQREGHYPAPPGVVEDIPGLEVSGTIVSCGNAVTQWKSGDQVCALLPGGGYAAFALAQEGQCLPVIPEIGLAQSATLPETLFTVWHNVFRLGRLDAGENLLVHGGSGGIGTTAIQLARAFGAHVYTTAGTDERCRRCEAIGADGAVNYRDTDFAAYWSERGLQMDVILDSIGGAYFERNLSLLAPEGRLVQINYISGRRVELDLLRLMQKRLRLTGSTLRARDNVFKELLRDAVEANVWPLLRSGRFVPVIDRVFPYQEAAEAHHFIESGEVFGKILLRWDD